VASSLDGMEEETREKNGYYSETSEKRDQYKIEPFCPLLKGCPLSEVLKVLFLIQKKIFYRSLVEK